MCIYYENTIFFLGGGFAIITFAILVFMYKNNVFNFYNEANIYNIIIIFLH